ncbi:MAG: KpsF/GutQ family sugar-phosphate isomerase [Ignavibacteria bacterium]|nr:KpsF/GutQ family sugar-phosphate isomerase [Ignavibacteria bacterium]
MKKKESKIIKTALEVLQLEADSILQLKQFIGKDFEQAVEKLFYSSGRVVVTGIGKSAIIANKISATLNSTGTPSLFMHAADAIHGDLGMMQKNDVVICISKSGESAEIKVLIPLIKQAGNLLIAITGNVKSFLALNADYILNTTVKAEACPNNLAPTTSTTAQLAMGDALAVCLLKLKGFTADDFAKYHPGGTLGKQLYLRVDDLYPLNEKPFVTADTKINEAILEISAKRLGSTAVVDKNQNLIGIITDGDLRRMIKNDINIKTATAKDVMTKNPIHAQKGELAINVLTLMRKHNITQVPVLDKKKYLGMVHVHDLLKEGLV